MAIAQSGSFNLGFATMPVVFQQLPAGEFFGCLWFLLLFVAGITSSVAMSQPMMAFLQDEFEVSRRKAAVLVGVGMFVLSQPVLLFMKQGFLDELDYWIGTFGLVVMALVEIVLFAWVFGMDRAWEEITRGAQVKLPRLYYYVIKYVTPAFLLVILVVWGYQDAFGVLVMDGVPEEFRPYKWGARVLLLGLLAAIMFGVYRRWRGQPMEAEEHVHAE